MKIQEFLTEEIVSREQAQAIIQNVGNYQAAQLTSAWNNAGSPTDLSQIRKILSSAKVAPQVLAKAMQTIGVGSTQQTAPVTPAAKPSIGIQRTFDARKAGIKQALANRRGTKVKTTTPSPFTQSVPHYDVA